MEQAYTWLLEKGSRPSEPEERLYVKAKEHLHGLLDEKRALLGELSSWSMS